jgi:hypothetical protein
MPCFANPASARLPRAALLKLAFQLRGFVSELPEDISSLGNVC